MNRIWPALVAGLLMVVPSSARAQFLLSTNANNTLTITRYAGAGGAVNVPETTNGLIITSIGPEAFMEVNTLTSITIADSVTNIGAFAFYECSNLISVTVSNAAASFGDYAFEDCTSLTTATLPGSLTNADVDFYGCSNLTSVTIANGATNIVDDEFSGFTTLTSVAIPGSVANIGEYAFAGCASLTNAWIANGVTSLGDFAFVQCSNLPCITIPGSVASLGNEAFYECTSLTNATLANGLKSIGDYAFSDCTSLVTVDLPGSITAFGQAVFYDCSSLTSVTTANGLTRIGGFAFDGCSNLLTVTVARTVTNIGEGAFENCGDLTTMYFEGNCPVAGASAFSSDDKATIYYFPGATGWSSTFSGLKTIALVAPHIGIEPVNQNKPLGGAAAFSVQATGVPLAYRWFFNGALLSNGVNIFGSASDRLIVNPIMDGNAGSYSVIVSNPVAIVTSKVVVLDLIPELSRPSVSILSPKAGSRSAFPVLRGEASDRVRVLEVAYWLTNVNNGVLTTQQGLAMLAAGSGAGSSNWTIQTAILPGTNFLAVQSSNAAGLSSPVKSVAFFSPRVAPLSLQVSPAGMGRITAVASLNDTFLPANVAALSVGERYILTAKPTNNWWFAGWMTNGVPAGANATLSFIMETNLIITANFASNLFAPMSARYDGIFSPSNAEAVTAGNSGLIENFRLGTNGAYSGKLLLAGTAHPLAGTFDRAGQTTESLGRIAAAGGNVTLQLTVLFGSVPRQIIGMVEGVGWTSSNLTLYAATTNRNNSSRFTMLLPQNPNAPDSAPPGEGYALAADHGVMINLAGMLSDGIPFSLSEPINEGNEFPVYASLYQNRGLLLGILRLDASAFNAAPNGTLVWIRPPQKTVRYPDGFETALDATGSPWTNSSAALATLFMNGPQLTFSGGGLVSNFLCTVQLTPSNTLERIKGSTQFIGGFLNRANGKMTVHFSNNDGQMTTGYGALLQNTNVSGGFFLGATNAGIITLTTQNPANE